MKEKVKVLMENPAFVEKMCACETPEAAQTLLAENGVELSIEEIKAIGARLSTMREEGELELDENELNDVSGGVAIGAVMDVCSIIASNISVITSTNTIARNWSTVKTWFRRW